MSEESLNQETKTDDGFEEWNPDNASQANFDSSDWSLDSSLDQAWDAAEEAEFKDVPPGVYDVIVDKVERKVAKTSGNPMLNWTLKITEGEMKGRNLFKNHVFLAKSFPYIKADFSLCKIVLSPPLTQAIENAMSDLVGIMLKVQVKAQKGGDGVNVYFKEFVGKLVGPGESKNDGDTEIPF
jgi:hypothetical protein